MIQVFNFNVYALLDPRTILSFVSIYVEMNFNVLPKQLTDPFSVSTPVGEFYINRESLIVIVLFSSITRVSWSI